MTFQPISGAFIGLLSLLLLGCAGGGLNPSEKMMWSTYAFGTKHALATCFVVAQRDPSAPGGVIPIIVTTGHLLATAPRGPFYLAARITDAAGHLDIALVEFQPPEGTPLLYAQHPRCDIIALELHIPPEFAELLTIPSFVRQNLIALKVPSPGDDVSVTGFPSPLPGTRGGFPVLRAGRVASYMASPEGEPQRFLVNTDVYSGDSGAPIFAAGKGRGSPKLVGMIVEHAGKSAKSTVPLAIAVDGKSIRETLSLLAEKHHGRVTGRQANKNRKMNQTNAVAVGKWRVTVVRNGPLPPCQPALTRRNLR